ncbi:hypothetical protein VTK73DRAFT_7457 [Phialemonium thermophilum]|uniref:Uncharacterized protein n=1 Tax=Phialemonium thermophilum TaxID=223376 RepID=A0ABR3WE79_9PEZI
MAAPTGRSVVERLQRWTTCDISDALSRLGHQDGGLLEGLKMYSPEFERGESKVVGPVFTVKFVPVSDSTAPRVSGNYIDQVPQDAVVFISQPLPHVNAAFGGLMSLRAQYLGAKGVVIDGLVRDLQEHRGLGFPVFARGHSTNACNKICFASEVNVPVTLHSALQDVTVSPSDYIIADLDGVVCVPAHLAEEALRIVGDIAAANEKCADAIRGGMSVAEAFATFRGKPASKST